MLFDNRKKKVEFYAVCERDTPGNFLTITCTKAEAAEYAYQYIKIKNLDHYEMWCNLREYDPASEKAWDEYFEKCISREEKLKYLITKITYKLKDVAAIMRMFGNCPPLGCSFDTQNEYNYLTYKLETQKHAATLVNKLNEAIEKQKEEQTKNGE